MEYHYFTIEDIEMLTFNGIPHLHNHLNYLIHTDKDQKFTNEDSVRNVSFIFHNEGKIFSSDVIAWYEGGITTEDLVKEYSDEKDVEEDREHQILLLLDHAVHLGWNIKHDDEGIYFHKTASNGLELGVHFDAIYEQESVEEFLDAIYEYGNEYSVAEELSYYANVEHYGQGLVLDDVIDDLKWFKDEVLEVHTLLENYHQELSQKENETIEIELEEIDKEL